MGKTAMVLLSLHETRHDVKYKLWRNVTSTTQQANHLFVLGLFNDDVRIGRQTKRLGVIQMSFRSRVTSWRE